MVAGGVSGMLFLFSIEQRILAEACVIQTRYTRGLCGIWCGTVRVQLTIRALRWARLTLGGVLACKHALPHMLGRGEGSIIFTSSTSSIAGEVAQFSYGASKAAVVNMTKYFSTLWGKAGVRVNTLTPGFFPAEQNRKLLFNDDGTPTARTKSIWGHTPMGRFGESHELIGACLFLASHRASSFVTGTDIRVDGGFLSQTI